MMFGILLPFFLNIGGYFCDFSEIAMMMATLLLACTKSTRLIIIPLAILGAWKQGVLSILLVLYHAVVHS